MNWQQGLNNMTPKAQEEFARLILFHPHGLGELFDWAAEQLTKLAPPNQSSDTASDNADGQPNTTAPRSLEGST